MNQQRQTIHPSWLEAAHNDPSISEHRSVATIDEWPDHSMVVNEPTHYFGSQYKSQMQNGDRQCADRSYLPDASVLEASSFRVR